MHDLKFIRENPQAFDAAYIRRGLEPLSATILELDEARRKRITEQQELQQQRNAMAKQIGEAMRGGDKEKAEALKAEATSINTRLQEMERQNTEGDALDQLLNAIPNLPADDVPQGADENDNKTLKHWGEKPSLAFEPKEHFDVGEQLGLMDFSGAAKLSGARFVILKSDLARLERALGNFMLDTHTRDFGYTEVVPPLLVNDAALYGTGQLPKFSEDLFKTTDGRWLIPTAEVSLTNMVADSILEGEALPLRFTAWTPCFRSEAGAAGRDTRGMIRQHQFSKVELVSITRPEQSAEEHERMLSAAETVLQKLGLHYRVVLLCTGDMGFSARKTYDIEVWLPGQGKYREISSCSNCGDFQARRMKARFRDKGQKETTFVNTLNGSGLAVGRTLVALLENYQQADGSILIPDALQPYMNGQTRITP